MNDKGDDVRYSASTRISVTLSTVLAAGSAVLFAGMLARHATDDGEICAFTDSWANLELADPPAAAAGVRVGGSGVVRFCLQDPDAVQRMWDLGVRLPGYLFAAVALLLLTALLRTAVRHGAFTDPVPRRMTALGWFLVLGGPVAAAVTGWSRQALVASTVPAATPPDVFGGGQPWQAMSGNPFPWFAVLAGLAALIFSRIMREAVRMREDLAGTV
ncbi:DUF2975 domain-containing protein [Saccharopolyspora gregorii]|uniref:DUF2975 domain-containing protein n=1 Tax=Saccharopolyspora gregorii TaxID=33914 RepID=UPI0021ABF700|nr:DUF2975 domain-containing protein [Saccharopolyspora gregorii]